MQVNHPHPVPEHPPRDPAAEQTVPIHRQQPWQPQPGAHRRAGRAATRAASATPAARTPTAPSWPRPL